MTELKTKTIQKQIVIQSQDLQMVTDNIGRMISNAEILVFLNNKNNKAFPPKGFKFRFNFFKYRNINEWNINDLRRALCQKINLTKMSFNDYIKEHPMWLMGYSDITSLLYILTTKYDIATIYGFNAKTFGDLPLLPYQLNCQEFLKGNLLVQHNHLQLFLLP